MLFIPMIHTLFMIDLTRESTSKVEELENPKYSLMGWEGFLGLLGMEDLLRVCMEGEYWSSVKRRK